MWYGHGFGWGGMIVGGLMMLVFWGGIIALIVWGVKSLMVNNATHQAEGTAHSQNAREILDQRYARGEIDRDEYESIKEDLAR